MRQAAQQALEKIIGAAPSREEAVRYLSREVREHLAGRVLDPADLEDLTSVWVWDDSQRTCTEQRMSARAAASWTASRIGAELYALAPDGAEARRLYLAAWLEWDQARARENLPAVSGLGSARDVLASVDAAALEDVLVFAVENGRTGAAVRALEALADAGDERLLDSPDGQPRPVAAALQHPERAVRFAAVETIMRWDPAAAYPGSSYLPETLAHLARTSGSQRVLVGHPRAEVAQTFVGMLNEIGFEADSAPTGRELFARAISSPDYEMILLSDSLDAPPVEELIQQLRREARTASLPIGVMTREANLERMGRFAEQDPLTEAFPRPFDANGIAYQVRGLLALGDEDPLAADERLRQAEMALEYLGRLAENRARYAFYDVLAQQDAVSRALPRSPLTAKAARVLGWLGSPDAQRAW